MYKKQDPMKYVKLDISIKYQIRLIWPLTLNNITCTSNGRKL